MLALLIMFLMTSYSLCKIPGKVTICSIGKNVEKAIPNSIRTIEGIGGLFEDYRVFIYENNSVDNSATMLKEWADKNDKVTVISEWLSNEELKKHSIATCWDLAPFRVCILAMARNIVLKLAMSHEFDEYEYYIMTEMDFAIPWNYRAIEDIFHKYNFEWDAILANGVTKNDLSLTYDTYTYRDHQHPFGPEVIGEQWWFNIPKTRVTKNSMVPVISAFGGLGIYKRKSIKGCYYSGVVNEEMNIYMENFFKIYKNSDRYANAFDQYQKSLSKLNKIYVLEDIDESKYKNNPDCFNYNVGIKLKKNSEVVWRFQSGITNYPVLCDHHPFHAAMANRGHDKFYVYSELRPIYG